MSERMDPITTTQELAAACERLARHPFVTVDTERASAGTVLFDAADFVA